MFSLLAEPEPLETFGASHVTTKISVDEELFTRIDEVLGARADADIASTGSAFVSYRLPGRMTWSNYWRDRTPVDPVNLSRLLGSVTPSGVSSAAFTMTLHLAKKWMASRRWTTELFPVASTITVLAAPKEWAEWVAQWQETVLPGGAPHDLGGTDRQTTQSSAPSDQLRQSLDDLRRWLGVSLAEAADATGISRGTVYAWRDRDSTPRATTTRSVLGVHALVETAVKAVGEEEARRWFHAGTPSPAETLISAKADATELRRLAARIRREVLRQRVPEPEVGLALNRPDIEV
jgi:hypothetical protein